MCVIILVISARKLHHQKEERNYDTVRYRRELETSSLTRRSKPTNSSSVTDNGAILITSPQEAKGDNFQQTSSIMLNIQNKRGSLTDSQSTSDSTTQLLSEGNPPLLDNHSVAEPAVTGLGTLPSAGVSAKDTSGTQLTRFVVLLIFLLFSCLVVSMCYGVSCCSTRRFFGG